MASQLRLFDPQLREKPEEESLTAPAWLVHLQQVERQIKEGAMVWPQDGAFPQQCLGTPSSEVEQLEGPGVSQPVALGITNPLLAVPAPSPEHPSPSVQLLPSAFPLPSWEPQPHCGWAVSSAACFSQLAQSEEGPAQRS
ncbi:Protein transport protein Sec16A [Saguinus oedipus]|uniref:Protein transport protein Sec16A n=1 Tax=Saguinus oedipus TaxID=9490 RepID=A0ABQ9WGB6_SAGOE|nr:Protein transport protein Sec16A [Saguinus oedipus]